MSRRKRVYVASYKGRRYPAWLKAVAALVLAGALSFCALLGAVLYGSYDHITGEPQVMVILGCQVMADGDPSVLLQDRLDTALDYLEEHPDKPGCYEFAMVGYLLGNTVTEHGHVARGVCQEDEEHYLLRVTEHTHIEKDGADARSTVDGGETWTRLPGDTVVSMNLWGFTPSFLWEAEARFPAFLDQVLAEDPQKGEYFLPSVVTQLLEEKRARVKVLRSTDKWYGVTYREDKPQVVAAIAAMTQSGLYPERLWDI